MKVQGQVTAALAGRLSRFAARMPITLPASRAAAAGELSGASAYGTKLAK